jgi:pimeloyl-ACP methyl ester carboxylesterase
MWAQSIEHGMVVRRVGTGPSVVWIHGLGESSLSFESTVAALPGYSHMLVDLPGCGRSPWPEVTPSLDDVANVLVGMVRDEEPAALVGHSLGGVLATLVAERTAVRGVVNIEGNITRGDCTFSAAAAAYTLDDFVAHGFAAFRDNVYRDGLSRTELRLYHAALSYASPYVFHRHARDLVALSESNTLARRLASLGVDVLFIAGTPNGICAESREALAARRVPLACIEGAGHWVYLDQPAELTLRVEAFLRTS